MTRLVLMRHGQTDWNVQGRFQGWTEVELNDLGREQAATAAPVVALEEPDVIVSSPLSRAVVTASAVAALRGLPVHTDERLREINVGTWAGLTGPQMAERDASLADVMRAGADFRRSATGENAVEVGQRVGEALAEATRTHEGRTVLVVSHGMAILMGTAHLLGWSYGQARQMAVMGNCAWSVLDHNPERGWRITAWNRRA